MSGAGDISARRTHPCPPGAHAHVQGSRQRWDKCEAEGQQIRQVDSGLRCSFSRWLGEERFEQNPTRGEGVTVTGSVILGRGHSESTGSELAECFLMGLKSNKKASVITKDQVKG